MGLNVIKIIFSPVNHVPKQPKLAGIGSKSGFDRTICMMPENSLA